MMCGVDGEVLGDPGGQF
jgi:hypothetical protein